MAITTNTTGAITQAVERQAAAPAKKTPAQMMNGILNSEATKKLLQNSLKENAGAFAAAVLDLYNTDTTLQNCSPQQVFGECLKAVSLKLPINKQLGFAYIIPRRNQGVWQPVFQLGYKGYIQLCMRTGAYKYINAGAVYEGELQSVNKLTGEVDISGEPVSDEVVGYFAYMETINGFRKCLYWSKDKVNTHAERYSDSYKRNSGAWKNNYDEMATKTVLRYLLSHYGVMSIEMEQAFAAENADLADEQISGTGPYGDVINAEETVEMPAEEESDE